LLNFSSPNLTLYSEQNRLTQIGLDQPIFMIEFMQMHLQTDQIIKC
jgi:hypothetical protein